MGKSSQRPPEIPQEDSEPNSRRVRRQSRQTRSTRVMQASRQRQRIEGRLRPQFVRQLRQHEWRRSRRPFEVRWRAHRPPWETEDRSRVEWLLHRPIAPMQPRRLDALVRRSGVRRKLFASSPCFNHVFNHVFNHEPIEFEDQSRSYRSKGIRNSYASASWLRFAAPDPMPRSPR